jgi:nucleoside-diphosphate-sugar epimerase
MRKGLYALGDNDPVNPDDSEVSRASKGHSLPSPTLVLGATSLVGQFLVARLVRANVDVLALSRRSQEPTPGVTWLVGDLNALEHIPGSVSSLAFSAAPIWVLPRALSALCSGGIRRLVAFSSTSRFTKDQSPVAAERQVAKLIATGEDQTRWFCEQNGVVWTILRPTLIYAEGRDRSITRMASLIERIGILPLAGDGSGKRQPVHADDLAGGALAAAASRAAENHAYDVPGGETLTYRAMSERIFEGLGRRPRVISIPPAAWRFVILMSRPLFPGITGAMGSRMAEDLVFNAEDAERDFKWKPRGFRPQFRAPR